MIKDNFQDIRQRIAACAGTRQVQLLAVSKTQPIEVIKEALATGQRLFGENRVGEAESKFSVLRGATPDLELHLIGPLQTNKVAQAVALFDVIQTLDRPKLAAMLAKEMEKQQKTPRLYIEINVGHEPQKAGVLPEEAAAFLAQCQQEWGLEIEGLMAIPPAGQDPTPYFQKIKEMANNFGLAKISMGMSADFETAITCGATLVRVGTALFKK